MEGGSVTSGAESLPSTNNALQQMMARNFISAQNKEWSGEPLVASREYPKQDMLSQLMKQMKNLFG